MPDGRADGRRGRTKKEGRKGAVRRIIIRKKEGTLSLMYYWQKAVRH